jgi:hypothetical protein
MQLARHRGVRCIRFVKPCFEGIRTPLAPKKASPNASAKLAVDGSGTTVKTWNGNPCGPTSVAALQLPMYDIDSALPVVVSPSILMGI